MTGTDESSIINKHPERESQDELALSHRDDTHDQKNVKRSRQGTRPEIAEQVGRDYDAFDLICHVAFDAPPLTRKERAESVKKRDVFAKYGAKSRAVLDALLQKYADSGLKSVESLEILKVDPLSSLGTPIEIIGVFGGKPAYLAAIRELESALYQAA